MTPPPASVRAGALLLGLLGPLAVTPLAALDMLWLGPQMIVAGIPGDPLFFVAGLVTLLGGAIPLACLALAARAWSGARRARIAGVALALVVAGFSLTPLISLSPLSWVPAGGALAPLFALATALVLGISLRTPGGRTAPGRTSRLVPAVCAGVAIAFAGGGLLAALVSDGIPGAPSALLATDFEGGERLQGEPLPTGPAPPPLGLANGQGSNIHNDSAMSDTYSDRHVIDPAAASVRSFLAPGDCASILFDPSGRPIAVCVGATRIIAYVLDPVSLEPLASRQVGERSIGLDFATNFAGGGYAALDAENRLIVPGADGVIERFTVETGAEPSIEPLDSFDVGNALGPDEAITSALPGSSHSLWFVGADGSVGLLDTGSGEARSLHFDGTEIENSFALAPDGGAYVATSQELVRLRPGKGGAPEVVWKQAYDDGTRQKPGQTSRASGTTPTVMLGGRFVAIADNAEPRTNVLVFDARPHTGGLDRLVCQVPVFPDGESATENSLIAAGSAIFVENNYGYGLFAAFGGHAGEPGAARIDLDPRRRSCETAWENDEISIPSVVSKVSAADGTVLTYTKPESAAGIDAWYFTAVDAGTGEILWKRRGGSGALANNHYAALYVGPGGELYVGALGGVVGLIGNDG